MEQELPRPSLSDIRVDEADESRWKVVDRRFRATHPRSLLGFIQRVDGRFEVTDLRSASDPVIYDDRETAVAAFLLATTRTPSFSTADQSPR